MAWNSKEEEALHWVGEHMRCTDPVTQMELCEKYSQLIFPREGDAWKNDQWTTAWGVTFVTMWDDEHLMKNIKHAMLAEMMNIGPMKYCVVTNVMPNFTSKLMLLLMYLPHKKICLYPPLYFLDGPFLRSPWNEIGESILARRINLKNPLLRTIYYTQQYVIFKKTGEYGTSYFL